MENINTQYGFILEISASELTQGMRRGRTLEGRYNGGFWA